MTTDEFKTYHQSKGGRFFEPEAVKLTRSQVVFWDGDTGTFVTGETHEGFRRYTLRLADFTTGRVITLGRYHNFLTVRSALLQLTD
jgi:hypothetical protein